MHSGQTYNFGAWNNSAYNQTVDASNQVTGQDRLDKLAKK
ncbi:Protein of unknown function [Lactobacillus equicursoris 66c]|uniref:Uncharacterized protein n=1 Tax=Lactobacillus equicursoris 66c TaxID=872326 RepID=K0NTR0_9LACO|nr:Protein of unknown function [Lactobacillus equicursoris 66c]